MKKMVEHFHICLRSGRRGWPPSFTVSLTIKYPFFTTSRCRRGMLYGQYTSSDLQLIFEIWSFVAVKGYSYFLLQLSFERQVLFEMQFLVLLNKRFPGEASPQCTTTTISKSSAKSLCLSLQYFFTYWGLLFCGDYSFLCVNLFWLLLFLWGSLFFVD